MDKERLANLLHHAIVLLEEEYGCCEELMKTDLAYKLGITQEEYDEIMA